MAARLVLLGLLVAGLVGMHQLPGIDDCCATSPAAGGASVSVGALDRSSAWMSMPSPVTTSHAASATVISPHGAAPVSVVNLLGMCLALLGVLGGLLAAVVLARRGLPVHADGSALPGSGAAAAPRAPPTGRHLAQLQVLRL